MGQIAASNRQVNPVIPSEILDEIDQRAAALSLTRSKFAALVYIWWKESGFPPVTKADEAMQTFKKTVKGNQAIAPTGLPHTITRHPKKEKVRKVRSPIEPLKDGQVSEPINRSGRRIF